MPDTVDSRLSELGIVLPGPVPPGANYIPTVRTGNLIYLSGQVSLGPEGDHYGKLGDDVSVEKGQAAARVCAINMIANLKNAVDSLDSVRFVKLLGMVNCTPDFTEAHKVINGASDLLVEVFGDKGRHARSAVGMGALPLGVAVEVEAIVEVS